MTQAQNTVNLTGRMWARLLASTNQPTFLHKCEAIRERVDKKSMDAMNDQKITSV